MGNWSIVVPEADDITNMVTNPRLQIAATGYSGSGAAAVRSTDRARRGGASLRVTPTATTTDGAYYGPLSLFSNVDYTFSVDFWGVDGVPYRIYFGTTAGVVKGTPTTLVGNGDWQRVSVTWTADATASFRLYAVKDGSASIAPFYLDGFQCVALDHDNTYIDGDQADCDWDSTPDASTSSRAARSRKGGAVYNLDDYGLTITEMSGIGMPPARHQTQEYASAPGAAYKGAKVQPRTFLLVGYLDEDTFTALHAARKALLDVIVTDSVEDVEPFILRYAGANGAKPVQITCVYDTGLGMEDYFVGYEKIALRLIAYDPWFYEDGNEAAILTASSTTSVNYFIAKITSWVNMGGTIAGGEINSFAVVSRGIFYAGGDFTSVNADANMKSIAYYNGAWNSLAGGTNGTVNAVVIGPDGNVYVGGSFSRVNGTLINATNIAYWDPVGATWHSMGGGATPGLNGIVRALAVGHDGTIYAGGDFTATSDGTTLNHVAKWTGSAWAALGSGTVGVNDNVYALAVGVLGAIHIGGDFTQAGGVAKSRIVRYDPTSNGWNAYGSGLNDTCYALAVLPNGNLIAGGVFTTAGGNTVNYIAEWTGSGWRALGTGLSDEVWSLAVDSDGLLYIGGVFQTDKAGAVQLVTLAVWNGSAFANLDARPPGSAKVLALAVYKKDIYLGFDTTGTALNSINNTATVTATRKVRPKFILKRSGGTSARLKWIKNETTGKTMWLNYALLDGEQLVIDAAKGTIVSSYYGSVLGRALLPGSELTSFELLPGDNTLSVFVDPTGSPTVTMWAEWPLVHKSADGTAA